MKPYYERNGITIYHGDARELVSQLKPTIDLLITDPPYQSLDVHVGTGTSARLIGRDGNDGKRLVRRDDFSGKRLAASDGRDWFDTLPSPAILDVLNDCRLLGGTDSARYVFADVKSGLEIFPRLPTRNVIVWDKGSIGMGYGWRRMHEWIAYVPEEEHVLRDKGLGDIIRCPGVSKKDHPTEKPIGVLTPLIRNSSDVGMTILDPFAGSFSTMAAAQLMGRKGIAIELLEEWCEFGAKRLEQMPLFLHEPQAAPAEQGGLI